MMMGGGGGGGIFKTVLNIVSLTPWGAPLRPVMLAVNTFDAIQSGNPLALASSAFSLSNYFPSDGFGTDLVGAGEAGAGADFTEWDPGGFSAPADVSSGITLGDPGFSTDVAPEVMSRGYTYDAALPEGQTGEAYFGGIKTQDQLNNSLPKLQNIGAEAAHDAFWSGGDPQAALRGVMESNLDYVPNLDTSNLGGYIDNVWKDFSTNRLPQLELGKDTLGGAQQFANSMADASQSYTDLTFGGSPVTSTLGGDTSTTGALGTKDVTALTEANVNAPTSNQDFVSLSNDPGSVFSSGTQPQSTLQDITSSSNYNAGDVMDAPAYDAGYTMDTASYNPGNVMDSAVQQGGNKAMNLQDLFKMFQPKPMSPWEAGIRGVGALDAMNQNRKAMGMMQEMRDQAVNWQDPNRGRGDFANQEWQKTISDPMHGYDQFMQGAGRDFVNQARATAAKSGNRGGYLNSGRMNTDLASLWAKNQAQRAQTAAGGFVGGTNTAAQAAPYAMGLAQMQRNANAPLFDVMGGIAQRGLKGIYDPETSFS